MAHHIQDVINILAELSEVEGLKVALSESAKGGLIAGGSTVAGGMLLGPVGLLVGAVVGGVMAFAKTNGKFKPVALVLKEMTPAQKKKLYNRIKIAITNINPHEVLALATLLMNSPSIQQVAMRELQSYLSSEMNLRCV